MSNIALLFPGQGSQAVGMAKDFYDNYPEAKEVMDQANEILGFSITELMFNGPEEELKKTENTQPALLIASIAMLKVLSKDSLSKGICGDDYPLVCAGHSLGEFTAYVASHALSFEDGLKTVRKRGELMANANPGGDEAMAAIIGLEDSVVEDICKKASSDGVVVPANYNCPGQLVISGDKNAVEKAMEIAKEEKAKMVVPLVVSGAFHSPLMEGASKDFEDFLSNITLNEPLFPVISNVSAEITPFENIKASLVKQLTSSVQWKKSVETMIKMGADTFIEVGSGKVLQGLVKKVDRKANILGINSIETIEKSLEKLQA